METRVTALELNGGWRRPLWTEPLAALEWAALRASPVYYGIGVPRGDGDPMILVPGFLGSDLSLLEMHLWLGRIGYRSYLSGIGRNASCPDILMERLLETVEGAYQETGSKVTLIGHSLGGLLARAAAVRRPQQVGRVITMASPFRRLSAHPLVLSLIRFVRGRVLEEHLWKAEEPCCECSFLGALREPMPRHIVRAAIYSKSDPVVDWRDCVEADAALNIEVRGTHIGLPFNAQVYREVAGLLAPPHRVREPRALDSRRESALKRAA